ncbi:hypothetical protein [Myxacorys almedinensis]|uniref:Uncharacterized protein n=1 Tax=Myxacorys almedinensis A TaxID=2690445 RepID=A0A8J8CI58_9CYAN|nr:hypothetical protein [Myxacorys almedinensis]NDJ17389.1 hypothetical protein [Myxacorys almedinensis A]
MGKTAAIARRIRDIGINLTMDTQIWGYPNFVDLPVWCLANQRSLAIAGSAPSIFQIWRT